jgi:hypothetical protein
MYAHNVELSPGILPCSRRRTARHLAPVRCEAVAEDGFRLLGRRALDLSIDGMLVDSGGAWTRPGEDVLLAFRLPRSRTWVDAMAQVRRVVKGRRIEDLHEAVAIEFTDMSRRDRTMLRHALRGLPITAPARRVRPDYAATVRAIGAGLH